MKETPGLTEPANEGQNSLDSMIALVEQAADQLESSKPEAQSSHVAQAFTAALTLINSLPEAERDQWIPPLEGALRADGSLKSGCESNDSNEDGQSSVNCGYCATQREEKDSVDNNWVKCPHKCEQEFCSKQCKRLGMKAHREKCPELRRRQVLRKIGLTGDSDLF